MVMTNWFGGINPVAQMQAGNDLLMPGTPQQAKAIIKAVQEGKLDVAVLDRNVERILNIILETPRFKNYKFSNKPDLKDHANITRQAATEGMILLKNSNNALPIPASDKNIAAFGNTSYDIITGGTGSGDVNEAYSVSLTDGLKGAGYILNQELMDIYDAYIKDAKLKRPAAIPFMPQVPLAEMKITPQLAAKMASIADIALITIGRNSGEMLDRKVEDDFNLTSIEKDMIRTVAKAFQSKGKKAVVILNIAGVIEVSSWKDIPDAILLAWQAGQETGNSITDVLSGKVNPSGKLTSTFPVSYQDVPSAKNFPGEILETVATEKPSDEGGIASLMRPKPSRIVYEEGLYVGYRYYETFKVKPVYEFGYGLSYTTFAYSNLKLSSDKFNGKITATVDITNSGKVYGKEVVQLYLSAPANKLDKPAIELKGFAKTKLLAPGESQSVSFDLDARQLASFDQERSSWIAEAGDYTVKIGASSRDIKQSAIFNLAADSIVKKESVALVPSETINERKASK
jgi:beta-glucosidase